MIGKKIIQIGISYLVDNGPAMFNPTSHLPRTPNTEMNIIWSLPPRRLRNMPRNN